jgi:DNA polymerase-3 subunit delta
MAIPALRKQIGVGQLAPLYLLTGDDTRLLDRIVDEFEATVDPADRPFCVERLYAGDPGAQPIDVATSARVLPMLGPRRIVIVMRAERWLKPKRATKAAADAAPADVESPADVEPGAADVVPLEDYVANPSPSSTLVFVAAEVDRTRRLTKLLIERAQVAYAGGIGADNPAERAQARTAALHLVQESVKQYGRSIDPQAAAVLVERAGGEVSKLRDDLERLRLYTEGRTAITREDVLDVASMATDVDEWGVVNAIADGDAGRALREAGVRMDQGDSPHALVGQLRWWVSTRLVQFAPQRVKSALDALFRTDLALKSSGGDDRVLIERLVVELASRR